MEVLEKRGYFGFVKIDSGGQATVYKTFLGDMLVAIKVVHVENPDSNKLEDDLRRELMIGRNVRHPNLVQVLDLFRSKSKLYIVMPFAENGTIGSLVRNQTEYLCETNVKLWFCPLAYAVQYLHAYKIAHRDIKLDNVLLDKNFNPMLTDFGYSRYVEEADKTDPSKGFKQCDTYCGTTSYNPPEILGQRPYNPFLGDVWCLGVALFIMFNKDYPFDRHQGAQRMLRCQLTRDYKYNLVVEEKMSEAAKQLVHVMLEPTPTKRATIQQVCGHDFIPSILRGDEFCKEIQKRFADLKKLNDVKARPETELPQASTTTSPGTVATTKSGAGVTSEAQPSPAANTTDPVEAPPTKTGTPTAGPRGPVKLVNRTAQQKPLAKKNSQ